MALNDTLSALTADKFMPILVDNIFNSNALCLKLLKNADKLDGGAKIIVPIEYAENHNSNSGWIEHNTTGATGQAITTIAQKSEWDWATAYNSIILSGEEKYVNGGSSQVVSILKARMSNAEKTIRDLFGDGLFNAGAVPQGPQNTGVTDTGGGNIGIGNVPVAGEDNFSGTLRAATGAG